MEVQLSRPIAFIDIETTGLEIFKDKIIEFSAIKIHPDNNEEIITLRINPEILISPEATAIHGIKNEDISTNPPFKEYAHKISDFLKDCDLGGFNIGFDLSILEAEFKRVGTEFSRNDRFILDVQTIYHRFDPRDLPAAHKKYCNKDIEKHHSAEHDVRATLNIFKSQLKTHKELPHNLKDLHDFCIKKKPSSWIDSQGKFVWVNNDVVMNFGLHKAKLLSEVVKNYPGFLRWMLTSDFLPDAKKIAEDSLQGIFLKK